MSYIKANKTGKTSVSAKDKPKLGKKNEKKTLCGYTAEGTFHLMNGQKPGGEFENNNECIHLK